MVSIVFHERCVYVVKPNHGGNAISRLFAFVLSLFVPFQLANAIAVTELPGQLQGCISSNACTVDISVPVVTLGQMEAYFYNDLSGGDTTGYAVRYSLLPPSARYVNDAMFIPFTGDVWLTVQNTYDLTGDSNRLTVYTDTVNPLPVNLLIFDSSGLDIDTDITNAALLSGAGMQQISFDDTFNIIQSGNMALWSDMFDNEFFSALSPCFAEQCLATATLNLLYLKYVDAGDGTASLVFNSADTRALLYEISLGFDPNFSDLGVERQSYYVAPVPVPAAVWLFYSGLLGLIGVARRKKRWLLIR